MFHYFIAASVMPGLMATEDFQFTFKTRGLKSTLSVPLTLPLNQSVEEFSECLIKEHDLPCFVEKGKYGYGANLKNVASLVLNVYNAGGRNLVGLPKMMTEVVPWTTITFGNVFSNFVFVMLFCLNLGHMTTTYIRGL